MNSSRDVVRDFKRKIAKEKDNMSAQDRELAVLYWRLQKKVHTDPKIRSYLHELTRMLKARKIRPTLLNDVGLELAMENRI